MRKFNKVAVCLSVALVLSACGGNANSAGSGNGVVDNSNGTETQGVGTVDENAQKGAEDSAKDATKTEKKVVTKVELQEITADVNPYVMESWNSQGGVIIAGQDDMLGAFTYDGKQIVDFKYPMDLGTFGPNPDGYFVLSDYNQHYIFDKNGNIIYSSANEIYLGPYFYTVLQYESENKDIHPLDYVTDVNTIYYDYYDFSGKLIFTSKYEGYSEDSTMGIHFYPVGGFDGKEMIYQCYYTGNEISEDAKKAVEAELAADGIDSNHTIEYGGEIIEQIGTLDLNGNVTWGSILYQGPSWYTVVSSSTGSVGATHGSSGASAFTREYKHLFPISPLNNGYFVARSAVMEFEDFDMRFLCKEDGTKVSAFQPGYMTMDGSCLTIDESPDGIYNDEMGLRYVDNGGRALCNHGSKIVLTDFGQYYLLDAAAPKGNWLLAQGECIDMSIEDKVLYSKDGQWGFIDFDGNVIKMYDDASNMYNGHAPVVHDGKAYIVNQNLEEIYEIGEATGVTDIGKDMVRVKNGDEEKYYFINVIE